MKPCLKTAAAREQKNAGRGGVCSFSNSMILLLFICYNFQKIEKESGKVAILSELCVTLSLCSPVQLCLNPSWLFFIVFLFFICCRLWETGKAVHLLQVVRNREGRSEGSLVSMGSSEHDEVGRSSSIPFTYSCANAFRLPVLPYLDNA